MTTDWKILWEINNFYNLGKEIETTLLAFSSSTRIIGGKHYIAIKNITLIIWEPFLDQFGKSILESPCLIWLKDIFHLSWKLKQCSSYEGIQNSLDTRSVRAKSRLCDTIMQTWYYQVCVILYITSAWYLILVMFLTQKKISGRGALFRSLQHRVYTFQISISN